MVKRYMQISTSAIQPMPRNLTVLLGLDHIRGFGIVLILNNFCRSAADSASERDPEQRPDESSNER